MVRAMQKFGCYGRFLPRQTYFFTTLRVPTSHSFVLHGGDVRPAVCSPSFSLEYASFHTTAPKRTACTGIVSLKNFYTYTEQGVPLRMRLQRNFSIRVPNEANTAESKEMATTDDGASSSAEPKAGTVEGNAKAEERISQWYSDPTACSMPRYALFCLIPCSRDTIQARRNLPVGLAPKPITPRRLRGVAGQVSTVVRRRDAACGGLLRDGLLRHDGHPHRSRARPRLPWRSAPSSVSEERARTFNRKCRTRERAKKSSCTVWRPCDAAAAW